MPPQSSRQANGKEEAVRWFRKSVKQGDPKGTLNLGASYYNGDGVAADDVATGTLRLQTLRQGQRRQRFPGPGAGAEGRRFLFRGMTGL
jgi:TPR repeat protein